MNARMSRTSFSGAEREREWPLSIETISHPASLAIFSCSAGERAWSFDTQCRAAEMSRGRASRRDHQEKRLGDNIIDGPRSVLGTLAIENSSRGFPPYDG